MRIVHGLLCRVGVHRWRAHSDQETRVTFHACDHCGKEKDTVAILAAPRRIESFGDWTGFGG